MRILYFSLLFVIPILTACQSDQQTDKDLPPIKKQPAASTMRQTPAPQLKLDLSQTTLKEIDKKNDLNLNRAAPVYLSKETKKEQKIDISTGLIFDKDADDPLQSVSGGEVKISVPLD